MTEAVERISAEFVCCVVLSPTESCLRRKNVLKRAQPLTGRLIYMPTARVANRGLTPGGLTRRTGFTIAALLAALAVPMVQCAIRRAAHNSGRAEKDAPELTELLHQGNAALRAGEYQKATHLYATGLERARRSRNWHLAVRFLNNLGSARYQMFLYRDAIQAYLEARDIAASQRDSETLGALSVSLSSLYFDMGDIEAARQSVDLGLRLPADATAKFRAKLLIQGARVYARKKNWERANALFQEAIEISRQKLDIATEAQAWNKLGDSLVEERKLSSAEHPLLEAFRLRKLTKDSLLYFAYESLGELRLLQDDPQSAATLFSLAIDAAPDVNPAVLWTIYYERGKARLAQCHLEEAFADFGTALNSARRWRAEVLPADAFRVSTEVELHELYTSYIELGSRLYARTGRREFVEETFTAAEENRAASLRALWAEPDLTRTLPAQYWETLAHLFEAEAGLVKAGGNADLSTVRKLRLQAAEMEARSALDLPRQPDDADGARSGLLEQTRRILEPNEVFLGFHLGAAESLMWILTRQSFELQHLPPQAELAASIGPFVKAIRENSPDATVLGRRLYAELFGNVSRRFLDKPLWILAPDGPLFEVPFAALVETVDSSSGAPVYVVEHHATQVVPGISALFRATPWNEDGPVVGVGDPIYNRADPRFSVLGSNGTVGRGPAKSHSAARPMEMARLVGSGREVRMYGDVWRSNGREPMILTGAAANRENLVDALRRNPSVLHIAAHVLFPPQPSGPGLIALALQPANGIELLSASEIGAMRFNLGVVVLNGCSSARGETLPGAGLMGMTRAWLAAGARAVIATRWATSDQQDGGLFRSFYSRLASSERLSRRPSFAQILQQAQLAALRSPGSANPANWAAYFCVETR